MSSCPRINTQTDARSRITSQMEACLSITTQIEACLRITTQTEESSCLRITIQVVEDLHRGTSGSPRSNQHWEFSSFQECVVRSCDRQPGCRRAVQPTREDDNVRRGPLAGSWVTPTAGGKTPKEGTCRRMTSRSLEGAPGWPKVQSVKPVNVQKCICSLGAAKCKQCTLYYKYMGVSLQPACCVSGVTNAPRL